MALHEGEYEDLAGAERQQELLAVILDMSPDGLRSPKIRDLVKKMSLSSTSRVEDLLKKLESAGYVERGQEHEGSSASGVWLTKKALNWLRKSRGRDVSRYVRPYIQDDGIRLIRLVGEVAAGNPISPDSYIPDDLVDDYVPLPAQYAPKGAAYILKVKGDSMIGDHICDGDHVVVAPYPDPAGRGEIVVALVDGDATVKHLRHRDGKYYLDPSNSRYESRAFDGPDEIKIQGRVVGLIRTDVNALLA